MKLQFKKRRLIPVALAILVLVVGSGVAYAYWTSGGSGSGTAQAGTTVPVTVNQTTVLTAMFPGDTAQTISGDFTNTNSGPVYVTSVTASIFSVTGGAGTCDATDFTLASAVASVGHEIAVGTNVDAWTGPTIQFNNKITPQDGCKGATVTLHYTVL